MDTLKIEYIAISELSEYSGNAKLHPKKQVEQIAESIKEFGFNDPIAIDENGTIIEGHGRVLAAGLLGMDSLPVIRLDGLTDEQKRAYTLVHNQLTMNSGFDLKTLEIELQGIQQIDMEKFDFSVSEIQFDIMEQEEKHLKEKEKTDFKYRIRRV